MHAAKDAGVRKDHPDEADEIERQDILDPNTRADMPGADSPSAGLGRGEGGEARPVGGDNPRGTQHGGA